MADTEPNTPDGSQAIAARLRLSSTQRSDGRLPLVPADSLRDSCSRADGVSAREETRLRATACSFIARAGKELQFKQLAIATACVYFHNFFVRFSFKAYDRFEIAAVCLFLAGKVEEQRRKVKDVAEICLMVRNGRRKGPTDPNVLKAVCDTVLDRELLLLSVVEFQFHPSHPYQYCMMVLKRIFQTMDDDSVGADPDLAASESLSKLVQKEIAQYAWLMINDSLKTTLCLQYKPEPIALACIDAAFRILNLDRSKPVNLRSDWFVDYAAAVTTRDCIHIWSVLLEVVELESAGHTGDSQVLWEKFRKVVSVAKDSDDACGVQSGVASEPVTTAPADPPGSRQDRDRNVAADPTAESYSAPVEDQGADPDATSNDVGDEVRGVKASRQEPSSKKFRTE